MQSIVTFEPLEELHLPEITSLWLSQYKAEISILNDDNPHLQLVDPTTFALFLQNYVNRSIKGRTGIIAKNGNELVGFMVYDKFEFHAEKTVYCSILSHAMSHKEVYNTMYQHLSDRWIKGGYLNHLISFFAHDQVLNDLLFEMGFGLYIVDNFRPVSDLDTSDQEEVNVTITRAEKGHIEEVMQLGKEFGKYLGQAPLFLVFSKSREAYLEILEDSNTALFLAYVNDDLVGYMTIHKGTANDKDLLCDEETGMIIDTFIQPHYRGLGIGQELLQNCITWCKKEELNRIRVEFESANLAARKFWSKYFDPVIFTVKRRVNQDIIDL
ncbi:MAG: GNAT family N-acetyltransferase [Candidatus Kariarchaeaceae archaeon]|jgi:GNAT superfamily N-acetyltransferase